MRKGWEYKKLGEVGTFLRGKGIQKTDFVEKGLPCIHYGQLHTIFGVSTDKHLSNISQELYEKSIIASKNDVLVALTSEDVEGSCRSTAWLGNYDVAISSDAAVYKHSMNPKFVTYYLRSNSFFVEKSKYARGFKVTHIKTSDIAKIPIPIPPQSTQLIIVSELDKINELIRLKKEQLKDFDNLAQSLFYEMFGDPVENEKGWEVKKLGEISSLICNGNTPKGGSEIYIDNGILFLRSQNVWRNRLDLDDVAFIDEATHKSLKKSALNHNDLLITKTGRVNTENSSLGRTALFEGEDGSANINGHVYLVRLKEGMVHKYVLYILISNSYRELIRRTCVGGIDKRQLNKNHIEDFPIILPSLSLQRLFAQRIEQIEREKSEVQKSIQDLETLLASRMQYWFE